MLIGCLEEERRLFMSSTSRETRRRLNLQLCCHVAATHILMHVDSGKNKRKKKKKSTERPTVQRARTSSVTLNLFSKATNFCLMLGCCRRGQTRGRKKWWDKMRRRGQKKRRMTLASGHCGDGGGSGRTGSMAGLQ